MCMIESAESCSLYDTTWRTARKEHRCEECRRTIAPGERYLRHAIGGEGTVSVYLHCSHCHAAATWLVKHCRGYLCGGVLEDLEEHWGELYDEDRMFLGRAIVGMRKKWRRRDGGIRRLLPMLDRNPTQSQLPT